MAITILQDKAALFKLAATKYHIAYYGKEDCFVNLAGKYDYLELPYYICLDYENSGKKIYPACKDVLDAYITPLFLERARLHGLPVPEFYITNGYFEPPVVVDTINPFMSRSSVVLKPGHQSWVAKSMTRNYTYAIGCQELPPEAQIRYFRSVLGWSISSRFRELSEQVWNIFHIPLARIRVIVLQNRQMLLSNVEYLPFDNLNIRELNYLQERIRWEE